MRQTWTLARREFRSYFDHPTAYILVVAFLALALFLTFRSIYATDVATLRSFFSLLPWLFMVFVPAITMRSLAEERGSGTFEWLIAQPVSELEVIAGKFLGDWLFVLVTLAGTLPTAIGILLLSEADPGIVVAQYTGAALLAAQMVAIGLFASSATKNQITAFILAVTLSFALILAGLQVATIGLPALLSEPVSRLSLLRHFESIARGVLDLRDVLYFVSMAGLFLGFAYLVASRQRLSTARGGFRRLRIGVAGIAAGVVVLNLLGARIHGRLDLTADNLYTLSAGTDQVLEGLDDVVTIKLFVSSELPPEIGLTLRDVRDLLSDYRRSADGRVRVVEAHPDEDEAAADDARSMGIREIQFNVVRDDELQVQTGWLGLAVLYADEQQVVPVISRTDDLEYRLTSMIATMTAESMPRLAFLTGYGARSAMEYRLFREGIARHYEVRSVNLAQDTVPVLSPDSFDLVVLAGPTEPLDEDALDALDAYLDAGGAGLFLLEGSTLNPRMPVSQPVSTGLEPLLERHGLRLGQGMVYDLRSNETVSLGQGGFFSVLRPYPLWPIVLPAAEHTLTRSLDALSLAWATPLEVVDSSSVQPLWATTEFGGRRPVGSPISPQMRIQPDPANLSSQVVAVAVAPALGGADSAPTAAEATAGPAVDASGAQSPDNGGAADEAGPTAAAQSEAAGIAESGTPAAAEPAAGAASEPTQRVPAVAAAGAAPRDAAGTAAGAAPQNSGDAAGGAAGAAPEDAGAAAPAQERMQSAPAAPERMASAPAAQETATAGGTGAGSGSHRGRLVVVGDADFLADRFVRSNPQNLAFAANAVDWLAQDEALIAIRSKDRTPPPLVLESEAKQAALKWGNLIGVPLLFIIGGAVRVVNRRRLAGHTWEGVDA